MNSQYQSQPGQYPELQNIRYSPTPGSDGQGIFHWYHQPLGPPISGTTHTSGLSTITTSQRHADPSGAQYLQQPSQYPPTSQFSIPAQSATTPVSHPQSTTADADQFTQVQYVHSQQSSMVPQPQVSQQPPVLQPQWQHPTMPQQSHQQAIQHQSMVSNVQYHVQSQDQFLDLAQRQTQQPPAVDFTQLLKTSPGPQQILRNDFSQLMQAAPLINTSSNVVTTTTTRTETYKGVNAGGDARKQAEAKGELELQRFEKKVQQLVRRIGPCPLQVPWYNSVDKYICGGGTHFLYHKDIDKAFRQPGWIPRVTYVNIHNDLEAQGSGTLHLQHPPQVAFHEPMHQIHRLFMRVVRDMGFALMGDQVDELREQGCDDGCLRGLEVISQKEGERHLRQHGYDPNATRHAMFR